MSLTPSFAEGLQSLLRERRYTFRTEASGLSPSSSRSRILSEMTADAGVLEITARRLRKEYNAHQPLVATLPPEILSSIFQICAETERPLPPYNLRARGLFESRLYRGIAREAEHDIDAGGEFEEPSWISGRRGSLGYIALSHVCTHWRNVMLGYTALWTEDIGALPDALPTVLSRAGPVLPLTMRLYGSTYRRDNSGVWDALSVNGGTLARRVKALYWVETREGYLERKFFARLPTYPFASLEKLVIWAHECAGFPATAQPPTLMAPRLRVADLTNVACNSTSTSLTELSIRTTWASLEMDFDPWVLERHDLRAILQAHSLSLTSLYLDLHVSADPPSDETSMEFSQLHKMYLRDHSLGGGRPASLLSGISYPASAVSYIHLEQGQWPDDPSELVYLFDILRQSGTTAPHGLAIIEERVRRAHDDIDTMSVLLRFYTEPAITLSTNVDSDLFGRGTHRLSLRLDYDEHLAIDTLLQTLSRCIPASGVKILSYTSSGFCDTCRVKSGMLMGHFSAVRTLHIEDPHIGGIVPALGRLRDARCMPGLERLWLTRSNTSGGHILSRSVLATYLRSRYGQSRGSIGFGAPARLKELRVG
ncbi:hypothetical protein PENSPDRAFT_736881, partial [Peniophora sp. CONT]